MNHIYQRFLLATAPDRGLSSAPGVDVTIQSVFALLAGIACWLSRFVIVFMVIMLVIYGMQFMTSQGNSTKFGNARTNLGWAVVGILVVFATNTIIATVAHAIDPNSPYSMFALNCSVYQ